MPAFDSWRKEVEGCEGNRRKRGVRDQGVRESGRGQGGGEGDTCGRERESGGPLEVERMAKVRGGGKKRRASCYTPRVCFSTSRHGDPLAFVTVMGWENSGREALESPTLVGDTCLNDYPVDRRKDVSIRARFCRSCCTDNNRFLVPVVPRVFTVCIVFNGYFSLLNERFADTKDGFVPDTLALTLIEYKKRIHKSFSTRKTFG